MKSSQPNCLGPAAQIRQIHTDFIIVKRIVVGPRVFADQRVSLHSRNAARRCSFGQQRYLGNLKVYTVFLVQPEKVFQHCITYTLSTPFSAASLPQDIRSVSFLLPKLNTSLYQLIVRFKLVQHHCLSVPVLPYSSCMPRSGTLSALL